MLVYGRTERALDSDITKFMLRYAPFPFFGSHSESQSRNCTVAPVLRNAAYPTLHQDLVMLI